MLTGNSTRSLLSLCVLLCFSLCEHADVANASSPALTRVMPRGVQRGTTQTLTFVGERLNDTQEVFFYDEGFRALDLKVINTKKVMIKVKIAPDCRLGEHMVQLRTRSGVSDYRIMHVEAYPSIAEVEPDNNVRENAQLIEPVAYSEQFPEGVGVVVSGSIIDEDHDWFAVDGIKGDRLSIEVVGIRLGEFCDTVLELHGPSGESLAIVDDTPLTAQDPFVSIKLPADGRYWIHLADAAGRGHTTAYYRMHVGNFPRPNIAWPAVAKLGEMSQILFLEDCLGPIKQTLRIKQADLHQDAIQVTDHLGTTPTPVPLRLLDEATEIFDELEPNDSFRKLKMFHSVPLSVHGTMDTRMDRDFFGFNASKGQRLRVEAFGHRIGSTIDTTVRVRRGDGRLLARAADSVGTDSLLKVTIPADGRYFVEIENALKRFGPMVRYQLDVALDQPTFTLGVQNFQRYSQLRQQLAVPAGNRFALLVTANREGFDGPIELTDNQLPESIQMFTRPMPADSNTMPVVFAADELLGQTDDDSTGTDATEDGQREQTHGGLIDFTGQSVFDSDLKSPRSVLGHFQHKAQLMRVQPNNMSLKDGVVDKLAVAVLEPVPFRVELEPPQVPISQNGRMQLRVHIHRDKGFLAPVTLRLPFRPPGISAYPTVRVKPNQKFIDYPINANGKATVGVWPICLTAVAPNDLGSMISTGLHDLEVVTPFVVIESDLISAEAGSKFVASCSLEVLREFGGLAEARLTALPEHVTSEPQSFSPEAQTIEFPIVVGKKCVTGKNHSVNVEVTVLQDGHPISFNAGRVIMRFSAPAKRGDSSDGRVVQSVPEEPQQ